MLCIHIMYVRVLMQPFLNFNACRRDLVVLLSSVGARGILRNQDLYQGLVQVLMQQVPSFDRGFLEVRRYT